MLEKSIGIQNREVTEGGTLIITMNPVNNARYISTPDLIAAEIAVQPYGVFSIPNYEDLDASGLTIYVTIEYAVYQGSLADLISGSIGDEITFSTAEGGGGGGGANDAEITKWLEGSTFSIFDSGASFIRSSLFYMNSQLTNIECTEVIKINSSAFNMCSNLATVNFPKVETIEPYAFANCSHLSIANISTVKKLSASVFQNCSELTGIDIPLVSSIYSNTFSGCINMSYVTAPSCTRIDSNAFNKCSSLTEIDFPLCSSVSANAFSNCIMLETVYLGSMASSSIYISVSAFYNCAKLQSLFILTASASTGILSANAFNNTPISDSTITGSFGSIYVPASMVNAFKAANNWSLFADRITAIPENADS